MEDRDHFRRLKGACPFYRENWINSGNVRDPEERDLVLYEIYCLKDTPPVTAEEQRRCLRSPHACWRLRAPDEPRARARRGSRRDATHPAP